MSKHAREIKLMLEGSINNSEGHRDQYQVTNMESVMNAIGLLEQTEIHVRDLQQYRIGHICNNIRRKLGAENNDAKTRLRRLIQNWQNMAKENDKKNQNGNGQPNGQPNNRSRNEIERQKQLNERLNPPTTDPVENGVDPPKKKLRGRPKKAKTKVEEIRAAPPIRKSPIAYDIADSPKVSVTVPRDSPRPSPRPVEKLPDYSGTINDNEVGDEIVPNSINLSKPIIDQSSRVKTPPPLPDIIHDDHLATTSSNLSKSRKRPYDTANDNQPVQIKNTPYVTTENSRVEASSSTLFSTMARFVPSVSVDSAPQIPATPKSNEIEKAANGDEWEGVSGVRDSKGNFHRWHDEIHLEPEGTEPFLHILPYVDIDLELL